MQGKNKIRTDIILIAGLLAAGAVLAVILVLSGRNGDLVVIRVDGNVVNEFPLSVDLQYEIAGAGGGSNMLVISEGCAWIEEADCPDGLCKNMGKINKTGQSIVCLPHRVVIEITGKESSTEPEVDIIVE